MKEKNTQIIQKSFSLVGNKLIIYYYKTTAHLV